jgi:SecD/SecF fusion protein
MQNKGIVIVVAVLMTLASIFYLSFSVATNYYDGKAAERKDSLAQQDYKDSVKYLGIYSYQKCLETQVGLGLDLKGGMNVILEVAVPELVDNLSGFNKDSVFVKSLSQARADAEKSQDDFISLFVDRYKKNAPGKSLAGLFAAQMPEVEVNSSDDDVVKVLKEKVTETITDAKNVITNRVDKFGVVQPNIQVIEGQSRIMVEMPGVKDPVRMRKLLQGSANLEFWETAPSQDIYSAIMDIDQRLANANVPADTSKVNKDEAQKADEAKAKESEAAKKLAEMQKAQTNANPLLSKVFEATGEDKMKHKMLFSDAGCIVLMAHEKDTAAINKMIHSSIAKQILPHDVKLLWGAKPTDRPGINNKRVFELYSIRMTGNGDRAPIEGDVVVSSKDDFDHFTGKPVVTMQMNQDGAREWANLTKKNVGKPVAIVLDDLVYSAPNVINEITGGNTQISGNFTVEDTKDLANTLKSGRMKAPVRIVQEEVVGPSLGAESIRQGIISFIVAFILLMIYMVLMYGFIPGMMANSALIVNLFFTMGIMASFQSALTMPGIAGIVLTLGMAVDANVLIYERTREEMRRGKNVRQALAAGYSNAFSAIFDSNLTSIITGVILAVIGTGPVKGFAVTLIIGICCSFFTAVFLTRLVYEFFHKRDKWLNLTFTTPLSRNLMQNTHFNFMGSYKISYIVWGVAALIFIGFFAIRGLSRSIDFTGGRNYVVTLAKETSVEDVRKTLSGVFINSTGEKSGSEANTSVIAIGTDGKTVRVSTNWNIDSNSATVDDEAESKLFEALKKAGLVTSANEADFKNPDKREGGSIISSTKVGPSIARDVTNKAIISVIVALIAIFLYILLRFRNVAFSIGSIVALAFDTLIVIGFFSALWGIVPFSLEIDQTFIGAILTVIGYSINDKVVVFDRVRENLNLYKKRDRQTLFNDSLNQTLARTVNTSVSTLIVLLCIFIFGGASIRSFSFAMILGVVFGTLSSLFIAAPTAYLTMGSKIRENDEPVSEKKK